MEHLLQFAGRLHPLVVHIPIGVLMLTVSLHFLSWTSRYARFREVLPMLWLVSFLSAVFASVVGYALSLEGDYAPEAVDKHMWLGIGLSAGAGLIYLLLNRNAGTRLQVAGVGGVAFLLFATGHYGGNLTHGEDYLTQPLHAFLGQTPPATTAAPPPDNLQETVVFEHLVQPILEEKCYNCHGATKQKGKLRLDSEKFITKGGKHGEILLAGQAEKSDLYARLVLPEEDDKRMPPKAKPQLTEQEIKLIYWWIAQAGGDFKKTVAEAVADEKTKQLLADLHASRLGGAEGMVAAADQEFAGLQASKASPAHVKQLQDMGFAVTFLTPEQNALSVNLVNVPDFSDSQATALLKLRDQLLWLDLSGTQITDKGLAQIARLKHLTRLSLDNTAVTDAGVAHLQKLPDLRYLNLYNTRVTDKSLPVLETLEKLQAVHLWQTRVTPQGVAALQKAHGPQLEVNFETEAHNTTTL